LENCRDGEPLKSIDKFAPLNSANENVQYALDEYHEEHENRKREHVSARQHSHGDERGSSCLSVFCLEAADHPLLPSLPDEKMSRTIQFSLGSTSLAAPE
jgi:hypothetical protein